MIKENYRKQIAQVVTARSFEARIAATQEKLNQAALALNRKELGPEVVAWIEARPAGADQVLHVSGFMVFKAPGSTPQVTAKAPSGSAFFDIKDGYGVWHGRSWPAGDPAALAVEELLDLHKECETETKRLAAALAAFPTLARLKRDWPEIWPSVPEHIKALVAPKNALAIVDTLALNARFGLPVGPLEGEGAAA